MSQILKFIKRQFHPYDMPASLQTKFKEEINKASYPFEMFILKYVAAPLNIIFAAADYYFNKEKLITSLCIRAASIPVCFLLLNFEKIPKLGKLLKYRSSIFAYYMILQTDILLVVVTSKWNVHQFFGGYHVIALAMVIYFAISIKESFLFLVALYIPYFIYCYFIGCNFLESIYDINMTLGMSILLLMFRQLLEKAHASEFLSKEQLQVDAQIGENIAQISHDTRAPLLALKAIQQGYFDIVTEKQVLNKSVARLIELVDSITQSASQLYINRGIVNLPAFFSDLKDYIAFLTPKQIVTFEINLKEQEYFFDAAKIRRVIINLVNNSVKICAKLPSQNISVNIHLQGKLMVQVKDNGPGVPIGIDVFKKGVSLTGSSGLGLAFCKKVVEEHSGTIGVKREFDQTVFWFEI